MTSTNSLNSNRFLPMFKNVFKRYSPLFIIVQILTAAFSVLISRFGTDRVTDTLERWAEAGSTHDITDSFVTAFSLCVFGAGVFGMFIIAVILFREIYSKRASTFCFSMPIKRGAYFNANMLFGLCTLITAFIIMVGTVLISVKTSEGFQKGVLLFDTSYFLQHVAVACLCVAVFYAIFVLWAAVSGRAWHSYLFSFIATWLVFMSAVNVSAYISTIWGLWVTPAELWIISPLGCFISAANDLEGNMKCVIALIIQFILAYAVGYVAFKKRKAESAEASPSGKIIPSVAIIICLISGCFSFLATAEWALFTRIFAAIISAVINTVILTAIFYRKPFTKMTVKCLAGMIVSMLVIVCAVEFIPSISYEKYLPEIDEIESVSINENVDFSDDLFSRAWEMIIFNDYYTYDENESGFTVTGDEAKEKVLALHAKMIEDSTVDNVFSDDYYYHGYYSVELTYKLKNGRTVTRSYCVGSKDIYDEYADLFQTDEVLRSIPPISINPEDIQYISVLNRSYTLEDWYFDTYGEEYDEYKNYDYEIYEDYSAAITVYAELDSYEELFDKILADRKNEPKDKFLWLIDTSYYVDDYDNIFREYYSGTPDYSYPYVYEDYEEYYPDFNDIQIGINTYSRFVTDEQKELIEAMTPEEKEQYESDYLYYSEGYVFDTEYVCINLEADTNTVEYLRSLGLIK